MAEQTDTTKAGWLKRALDAVRREVASWPQARQDAMRREVSDGR